MVKWPHLPLRRCDFQSVVEPDCAGSSSVWSGWSVCLKSELFPEPFVYHHTIHQASASPGSCNVHIQFDLMVIPSLCPPSTRHSTPPEGKGVRTSGSFWCQPVGLVSFLCLCSFYDPDSNVPRLNRGKSLPWNPVHPWSKSLDGLRCLLPVSSREWDSSELSLKFQHKRFSACLLWGSFAVHGQGTNNGHGACTLHFCILSLQNLIPLCDRNVVNRVKNGSLRLMRQKLSSYI